MSDTASAPLDLREQLARIDLALSQNAVARVSINDILARIDLSMAEHDRSRQEHRLAPWAIAISGMTSGAALLAAGFALARLFQ